MTDEMSREHRIADLRIIDNVGDTDGIDLLALSDEEFDLLEEEVWNYTCNRADAWKKAYENKQGVKKK